jgi:hypothetical protein
LQWPLPGYVNDIATSLGSTYDYQTQILGGSSVQERTSGSPPDYVSWPGYSVGLDRDDGAIDVIAEVSSGGYTDLVLSPDNFMVPEIADNELLRVSDHYVRLLNRHNAADGWLYHPWLDLDRSNPAQWVEYERGAQRAWECVAAKVSLHSGFTFRNIPASGALAELVSQALMGNVPTVNSDVTSVVSAFFTDSVHPTGAAAYFESLVVYNSLYSTFASGTSIAAPFGMSPTFASALQLIAGTYVADYQSGSQEQTMPGCAGYFVANQCDDYYDQRTATGETVTVADRDRCRNELSTLRWRYPSASWVPLPLP